MNNWLSVDDVHFFAWFTAILFLIYPFHNEAVIWAIGRGIVLSGFFGFLSLLVIFMNISNQKKYLLSSLLYFVSMCGYETSLPLPVISLILLYTKDRSFKKLILLSGIYLLTLLVNIIVRIQMSGTIWGSYGSKMFASSLFEYGIKFLKASARLFLPPSQFSVLLSICFALLFVCIAIACMYVIKKKDERPFVFIAVSVVTFLSLIIPAIFGISTRDYGGDRVFYFSSFFLCIWIVYLLSFLQNKKMRWGISLFITSYFLFFFYQSVLTWRKSSSITGSIINTVKNIEHRDKMVYLINMPEEYNGAHVFRNGFKEALLINQIDTSGIHVINYLTTEYSLKLTGPVKPVKHKQGLFIYPGALVSGNTIMARVWTDKNINDSIKVKFSIKDKIYYWNKASFVLLENPF